MTFKDVVYKRAPVSGLLLALQIPSQLAQGLPNNLWMDRAYAVLHNVARQGVKKTLVWSALSLNLQILRYGAMLCESVNEQIR